MGELNDKRRGETRIDDTDELIMPENLIGSKEIYYRDFFTFVTIYLRTLQTVGILLNGQQEKLENEEFNWRDYYVFLRVFTLGFDFENLDGTTYDYVIVTLPLLVWITYAYLVHRPHLSLHYLVEYFCCCLSPCFLLMMMLPAIIFGFGIEDESDVSEEFIILMSISGTIFCCFFVLLLAFRYVNYYISYKHYRVLWLCILWFLDIMLITLIIPVSTIAFKGLVAQEKSLPLTVFASAEMLIIFIVYGSSTHKALSNQSFEEQSCFTKLYKVVFLGHILVKYGISKIL